MTGVLDQAAGLRSATSRAPDGASQALPLIAVASGKGGVGKTFLAVNLALAFRELGWRPLLLDLDWGLANVDVALGFAAHRHAGHVLSGACRLEEALLEAHGIRILANACGDQALIRTGATGRADLLRTARAGGKWDLVIADTHPGLGDATTEIIAAADTSLVVCSPDPTALTDTYALLKVLHGTALAGRAGLVVNGAASDDQGAEVAEHLDRITRRFLGSPTECWGAVLEDPAVSRAVRRQEALLLASPRSAAARGVRAVAAFVDAALCRYRGVAP